MLRLAAADSESGEHDCPEGFDGAALVVADRPGLHVVLGLAE